MRGVVLAVVGVGLLLGTLRAVGSILMTCPANGLHTPALMEGVVAGKMTVSDEASAVMAAAVVDLFEAAHFGRGMKGSFS